MNSYQVEECSVYYDVKVSTAQGAFISISNDVTKITTVSTINSISNEWRVECVPRDINGFNLYNDIPPMSYIEITLQRYLPNPVVIMRGFVNSISKTSDFSGNPSRKILITGENYGKLISIAYPYYFYGISPPEVFAAQASDMPAVIGYGLDFFASGGSPSQIMSVIFDKFVTKNLTNIKQYISNRRSDDVASAKKNISNFNSSNSVSNLIKDFVVDVDVDGVDGNRFGIPFKIADPSALSRPESISAFVGKYINRPWNEAYTYDGPDKTYFVFRPSPWRDRNGKFIVGTHYDASTKYSPKYDDSFKSIDPLEIVSFELSRSDHDVFNYYMTDAYNMAPGQQYDAISFVSNENNINPHFITGERYAMPFLQHSSNKIGIGSEKIKLSPYLDYARMEIYGLRGIVNSTPYLSFDLSNYKDNKLFQEMFKEDLQASIDKFGQDNAGDAGGMLAIGQVLNQRLVQAYEHNSVLEKGYVVVNGREDIHPGMYVKIKTDRLDNKEHFYYVVNVEHSVTPYEGLFYTSLELDRGEGHLDYIRENGGY